MSSQAMMRVLVPTQITDAMLISSSVPENDYPAWSAATTYALGGRVISAATHRIYESAQANNLNHDPTTDASNPPWWIDVGPTNQRAMFDNEVNTQTVDTTAPLTVTIKPGRAAALGLMELDGDSVTVTMTTPGDGQVFSRTVDLIDRTVTNWYEYFFAPFRRRTEVVITDLPLYADGEITVTITASSGTAKCGVLAVGMTTDIGELLYAPRIGIIDYSRKETDAYGVTSLVKRNYSKRISVDLQIDNNVVSYVYRALAERRATACLWIGSEQARLSMLIGLGFYRDFTVAVEYPSHSQCSLEIEGMI